MPPLKYHFGQLALQVEANTTSVAEQLARWEGPVAEFAYGADIILLAAIGADHELAFTLLSGKPPHIEPLAGSEVLRLKLPFDLADRLPEMAFYGGLAISLSNARRARINGRMVRRDNYIEMETTETFTLCKKYIAPTIALDELRHIGPVSREPIGPNDPWITDLLARSETAFLASISPDNRPDVAHRGGPKGFIKYDAETHRLAWNEFVGDGIFKSAGNLRATGQMTLLVPEFDTGDGIELIGRGNYQNIKEDRKPRMDALVQYREEFPIQGVVTCEIHHATRLHGLLHPRRRLERALKITSRSTISEQAPQ